MKQLPAVPTVLERQTALRGPGQDHTPLLARRTTAGSRLPLPTAGQSLGTQVVFLEEEGLDHHHHHPRLLHRRRRAIAIRALQVYARKFQEEEERSTTVCAITSVTSHRRHLHDPRLVH